MSIRSLSPEARRVMVAALAAAALKVILAATTGGTDDIVHWTNFSIGVDRFGPIGIYGHPFSAQYNHPPLAGWWLMGVNLFNGLGFDKAFLIRLPAIGADVWTCWLAFRLLGERSSPRVAATAAIGIAWSPVLLAVSGYHGNTDPVFVMLTLTAYWLLTRRDRPFAGGVALGLALSVKLVPVVALPWMVYLAVRRGRVAAARFVGGAGVVFAVLWLPVVALRWSEFADNVLFYRGVSVREWGLAERLQQAGHPGADVWLAEHGSLVPLVAALIPFVFARARSDAGLSGLGLSLVAMLVLSPAFGLQYLSWALVPAYLVSIRFAWLYNVTAGVFAVSVYSSWNGAPPWGWDVAIGAAFTPDQLRLGAIAWACLVAVLVVGMIGREPGSEADGSNGDGAGDRDDAGEVGPAGRVGVLTG